MTRCCSCFTNCAPDPAAVTINTVTNNYVIAEGQIGWRQEQFDSTDFAASEATIVHDQTGVTLAAKWYVELAGEVAARASMLVFLGGTVPQRPLIGYSEDASTGYDYFVDTNKLYINFDLAAGETIYVQYVALPTSGTALETASVGNMAVIEDDGGEFTPPAGWVIADGTTPYSTAFFANLYDWFVDNYPGMIIETDATTETYCVAGDETTLDPDTGFVVPEASFVIRYLAPYTYAPLPDPTPNYRERSADYRVIVKT